MQDLLLKIEPQLVDLSAILITALCAYITMWVKKKTASQAINNVVGRATHDLGAFVAEQAQMVDKARDPVTGVLTSDAASGAKAEVVAKFKAVWGKDGLDELMKVIGVDPSMLDAWLSAHTELAVRTDNKSSNVSVTTTPSAS